MSKALVWIVFLVLQILIVQATLQAEPHKEDAAQTSEEDEAAKAARVRVSMIGMAATLFSLSILTRIATKFCCGSEKMQTAGKVLSICLLYYSVSISLVVFNKWFLHMWEGGFRFPLLVTSTHLLMKALMSAFVVKCTSYGDDLPEIPKRVWWLIAVPIGISTALDVGMSNRAFLFVTVSFYTIVKSSSLIFVLIFSVLFRLQPASLVLLGVVITICSGIALASAGEAEFVWEGFILCLGGAAFGGFRWALTQVLMGKLTNKLNSLLTIYTISPASALTLVPFVFAIEAKSLVTSKFFVDPALGFAASAMMLASAIFAFLLIFVELLLIHHTSSLTMGVAGYIKEILQILLSVIIFNDHLTPLNVFGLVLAMSGSIAYAVVRADSKQLRVLWQGSAIKSGKSSLAPQPFDDSNTGDVVILDSMGDGATRDNGPHEGDAIEVDLAVGGEDVEAVVGRVKGKPKNVAKGVIGVVVGKRTGGVARKRDSTLLSNTEERS